MKKMLILLGVGLIAGTLHAACFGPFCYDDSGFSIGGVAYDGNGMNTPVLTKAQILAAQPKAVGQMVRCSDCAFAQTVCISTSALQTSATNQYVVLVATGSPCH